MVKIMDNGEHTLKRQGCDLHFWLSGVEGKPLVVFTHGATLDHRSFNEQVKLVESDYRVLNWDVRGHGLSQPIGDSFSLMGCAEDLLAIMDAGGYAQATFVGLSMGGNIAQELVFAHPERVTALVLLDCACNTLEITAFEKFLVRISVPMLRLYPAGMLRKQIATTSSIRPEVRGYIEDACSKVVSNADFMTIWAAVTDCLHEEPGYRINKPLLLAHGDHDNLGNIRKAMPTWAKRDGAQYMVIPNAGHTSNQDNPAFFNLLLTKFLKATLTT